MESRFHAARAGRGAPTNMVPQRFGLAAREVDGDWLDDRDTLDGTVSSPHRVVRVVS